MKPTTRIKRVAAVGAAAGLAVLGMAVTSHGVLAGSSGQPSGYCTDGQGNEYMEQSILSNPVSLSFEIGTNGTSPGTLGSLENLHVALCYSDTQSGTPSSLAGGAISVFGPQLGTPGAPLNANGACLNDTAVVFQPNCSFNTSVLLTEGTGSCGVTCGVTVTATIPFEICAGLIAGVHPVGSNCSTSPTLQTAVGETGLIVSTITIGQGPGGTLGVSTPVTTLYLDGIAVPLAAGAGVTPGTVGAGITQAGGPLVCASAVGCLGAYAAVAGGPLAVLVLPGVGTVNITPPGSPQCVEVNYPTGPACPPPPYLLP